MKLDPPFGVLNVDETGRFWARGVDSVGFFNSYAVVCFDLGRPPASNRTLALHLPNRAVPTCVR